MLSTIILSAQTQYIDSIYTTQIVPIKGKPAIARIIESIKNSDSIILVLDKNNTQTISYIQKRYPHIKLSLVDNEKEAKKCGGFSILDSLNIGLNDIDAETSTLQIVLGDTLCPDITEQEKDLIAVSSDFISSKRWCLVETDKKGLVKQFYDKQENIDLENKKAIVGFYRFTNPTFVQKLLKKSQKENKSELSDLLIEYNKIFPIECVEVEQWFDFGHKAGLVKAQNYFYNSRDFNTLQANPILGTITKTSSNFQKLFDEYFWYNNLPKELQIFTPRTLAFDIKDGIASLSMEMYGYPPLSELFIYGALNIEEWELILKRLFEVHKTFEKYTDDMNISCFEKLYIDKTWKRFNMLLSQDDYWKTIYKYKTIFINGKEYKNINDLKVCLTTQLNKLVKNAKITAIHGDFCFSNILFDTKSFVCRLIDPRGRIDNNPTVYGDPRYDIAKLRHSVVGGYDYAVHGLFNIEEDKNHFTIKDNYPDFQPQLTQIFDNLVVEFGYDLKEIQLIEALLFLSMIPLHKDNTDRQKIFYLKAVKKLNNCLEDK